MKRFAAWWDAVPRPVRDFAEFLVAAGAAGGIAAIQGLNLNDPNLSVKVVLLAFEAGANAAIISVARAKLADSYRVLNSPPTP